MNGTITVPLHLSVTIYRYQDVRFCIRFGAIMSEAKHVYNKGEAEWSPETEVTDMIMHGVGTRIVHVVFWSKVTANSHHYDHGMH